MNDILDKTTFTKLSYGVYIISSRLNDKFNGQIATAVMQVTSEPSRVAIALNKNNLTHEYILKSGLFSITVLGMSATLKFIGQFGFKSGRDVDKFTDCIYEIGENGCPVIMEYSIAIIEAKVNNSLDVGTHTIFVGDVVAARILSDEEPMTYSYYHKHLKGKSPKTAPTYIGK